MLSGHAISLHDHNDSDHLSSEDPASEVDDEEAELSEKVLYRASFEELKSSYLQYDTVIWILISLLLVLAWGIGVLMLLYLPFRRHVLRKDISSRKLYVTPDEIVYKVVRPSFLPFLGFTKMEDRIPLHLIIDFIIEQGCLQAIYGVHTVRIDYIARRKKAAPVDELHVQGVFNPGLLRKVVITEASKTIQEAGYRSFKNATEGDFRIGSLPSMSPSRRFSSTPRKAFISNAQTPDIGSTISTDLLLHKLEEVKLSVKDIEQLVTGPSSATENIDREENM